MTIPDMSGLMVLECDHSKKDTTSFGELESVIRCSTCGNLFLFGSWHNVPRFALALIISGSEARPIIKYIDEARERDGIPYPPYSLEDYKDIAEFLGEKNLVDLFKLEQEYYEEDDEGGEEEAFQ